MLILDAFDEKILINAAEINRKSSHPFVRRTRYIIPSAKQLSSCGMIDIFAPAMVSFSSEIIHNSTFFLLDAIQNIAPHSAAGYMQGRHTSML
jgi:hypothetical protein